VPTPFRTAASIATAISALVSLGGCQTTFDLVGVAQPLSASESRDYNGSYQGNIRQISATAPGCPKEHGEKVIMVGDGVLWYAYSPVILFTSPIQYDGKIDATSGNARMEGQVTGNHLEATVTSPNCKTTLSLNFILNHSGGAG
jgi:hypothetical protein